LREVVDVQAGLSTPHRDALLVRVLFQQTDRESFQPGQILSRMTITDSAFVLAKRHVQTPVQRVLDGPMASDERGESSGIRLERADVVTNVAADLVAAFAHPDRQADRSEADPLSRRIDLVGDRNVVVGQRIDATVSFEHFHEAVGRRVLIHDPEQVVRGRRVQRLLIAFQGQHVVTLSLDDRFGEMPLTAGGIDRDHGTGHLDLVEQRRNRRDFIGFRLGRQLLQTDAAPDGLGTDQEQWPQSPSSIMGSTDRLPVDGDVLDRSVRFIRQAGATDAGDPGFEASLKRFRTDRRQNATDRVVRGMPFGSFRCRDSQCRCASAQMPIAFGPSAPAMIASTQITRTSLSE